MAFHVSVAHSDVLELLDAIEAVVPLQELAPRQRNRLQDVVAVWADQFAQDVADLILADSDLIGSAP